VETRLSQSPYLAGDSVTAGDILLTVIGNWSANFPTVKIGPNTKKLFKTIITRPAYQKALAAEKVEYKVAA
jgi:glutathione S-transferase